MRVVLATPKRSDPGSSLRAYALRMLRALLSVPGHGDARLLELPLGAEAKRGGVARPLVGQALRAFPVDGSTIWHATEPNAALRGTDVVTLHDLYEFQEKGPMMRAVRMITQRAVHRARRFVVQTEHGRSVVRAQFGPDVADRTRVVPPAFEPVPPGRPLQPDYDLLWVGNLDGRKQPDRFLLELSRFPSPRLRVAFFCHRSGWGDLGPVAAAFERARQAHTMDWIDRKLSSDELDKLYRRSRVLVSTSTVEGFHLPPMEAWLRGTRLLLPDIDVYREIYGRATGVLFYPPAEGFGAVVKAGLEASPFSPDSDLMLKVSDRECGSGLWKIYGEIHP